MRRMIIFGAGEDAVNYMVEATEVLYITAEIIGYCTDNKSLWGMVMPNRKKAYIENISEFILNERNYEVVICCKEELVQSKRSFLEQLGIAAKNISYFGNMRFNVGTHKIDWNRCRWERKEFVKDVLECGDEINELEKFYYLNEHNRSEKYMHYFEIYDRHLKKYRDKECVIVEIGVFQGGSLQMWKQYFGKKAKIVGIDINPDTKQYEDEQIKIEIGSQADREFWKSFKEKYPKVDVLIDDGGHKMNQQIIAFEEMYEHLAEEGVYLCEDLHTSYWESYGGGYKKETFMEYSKNFIDYIHAWYSNSEALKPNQYTKSMQSLHYYDSIMLIEKRRMYPVICMDM